MTAHYSFTTEEHGFPNYAAFDDTALANDLEKPAISRIIVEYGSFINSLTVHYVGSKQPAVKHGGDGTAGEVVLDANEWIIRIEGSIVHEAISSLEFSSNRGKSWGPYGSVKEPRFVWEAVGKVPSHSASHMGLLYFQGTCDDSYIRQLKATFADYSGLSRLPALLKFEKQTVAGSNVPSVHIFSTFARQLMSPIIILRIGPDNTQFRAYEDILCRLPFFRAALQGSFKEASEKTITMPDDEPSTIAALIEFLSTGSYTYTFQSEKADETADTHPADVTQGFFHAEIHAMASKYGCGELAECSLKHFAFVVRQLDGLDVIRLWKAAYLKGIYLTQFEADGDLQSFIKQLHRLVGDAYKTDREEMEAIVSLDPALASDLLRLITIR